MNRIYRILQCIIFEPISYSEFILAMIGWIDHNRFSKNGNLIAYHTSKENKKSFETFLPVNQLNFHCFSNLWKNGESSTTLTYLINEQEGNFPKIINQTGWNKRAGRANFEALIIKQGIKDKNMKGNFGNPI